MVLIMRSLDHPDLSSISFWTALVLQISIALALLQVNHVFTIIRSRTMLPTIFYLLMTASCPLFYTEWKGSVAAAGILVCLVYLFASYQKADSTKNAFNIGMTLTLCSLVFPPVLLLFPLFWYGFYSFQSFNFKTFFATTIGMIIVYLFAFVWNIYSSGAENFFGSFFHYQDFWVMHPFSLNIQDFLVFGLLFVLFVIAGFKIFVSGLSEKIRTGSYLKYLYFFSICIVIALVLQSEWKICWSLLIYVPLSFILSHFFTLSTKKITSWMLVFVILFFFGMYVWQEFFQIYTIL